MKTEPEKAALVDLICGQYCSFYKPGQKEEMACQGFESLQHFFLQQPDYVKQLPPLEGDEFEDECHHLLNHCLCQSCDFYIEGCDFTDPAYTEKALPCGGYIAIDLFLRDPTVDHQSLLAMLAPKKKNRYALLSPHCALKHLERPYLYDIQTDDLFELDENGFDFLKACIAGQTLSDLPLDKDFLETCFKEGLLRLEAEPVKSHPVIRPSPVPSLRYLELQLTNRCNLKCRHCYLGEPAKTDLPINSVLAVLEEFEEMQGLRVLFSGGEPQLYPHLRALNDSLPRFRLRKVLLTNGTLISESNYSDWCNFDEIQFSLDGLEAGHEKIRGKGTFEQTTRGMKAAKKKGVPVSAATMVHRFNLDEFEALSQWLEHFGVMEWNIDVPCASGRLCDHDELMISPEEGAPFLAYATGGSYHGADEPYACGYHLCTVTPEGRVLKCGFFAEQPLGSLKDGLETSWKRSRHFALSELECAPCEHLLDCKGGCRFRAENLLGKDPVMCALYGV
jgi:radical SAM protein with 4Fe4S-binding SPASM domain